MKKRQELSSIVGMIDRTEKQNKISNNISHVFYQLSERKCLRFVRKMILAYGDSLKSAIVSPRQIYHLWGKFAEELKEKPSKIRVTPTLLWLTFKDCLQIYIWPLLYTIIALASFLILVSLILSIGFVLFLLLRNVYLHFVNITTNVDANAWIGFVGSLIGGLVTVLGIILTLKHERRRDERNRIKQAEPVIILRPYGDNVAEEEKKRYSSCSISFGSLFANYNKESEAIKVDAPPFLIENIGFNIALNIEIDIHAMNISSANYSGIGSIESKENTLYRLNMSFLTGHLEHFNWYVHKEKGKLPLGDLLRVRMLFDVDIDDVELVASTPSNIFIKFQDLYGVIYEQRHEALILITSVKGQYYAGMTYQNYAKSKKKKAARFW